MTDIIEKLRGPNPVSWVPEAIHEIERLRGENKEQQASIRHLLDLLATDRAARILQGKNIAELSAEVERLRTALEAKDE